MSTHDLNRLPSVLNRLTRFTRSLLISGGLVALLGVAFAAYVRSENKLHQANHQRHQSYLLADELRQSGDDLTRMVRSYAATGNPIYKQHFQDILDIRDGKKPRPESYSSPYWDLVTQDGTPPRPASSQSIPLLDLMRQTGFTQDEFQKLAEAKANSDALTGPEFESMKLAESKGPDAETNRARAIAMLFDDSYHQAKLTVMKPIYEFFMLVDTRTLRVVQTATAQATSLRWILLAISLALMAMLWHTYTTLREELGGSLHQVYTRIALIGSGDFSTLIPVPPGRKNSVLGWLAQTQTRLHQSTSERASAETQLRNEKLLSDSLINNLPGIFCLFDQNGSFLRWNINFERISGYSTAEISSLKPLDFFPEHERHFIQERLRAVFTEGQADTEAHLMSKTGQLTAFYLTGQRIEFNGKPCIVGLGLDITARREAEGTSRRNESRFRAAFEQAAVGMAEVDLAGRFTRVNDRYASIVGRSREELLDCSFQQITHPEDLTSDLQQVQLLLTGQISTYSLEKRYLLKDASVVWVNLTVSLVRDLSGSPDYFIAVVEDISTRKQSEAALKNLEWMLTKRPAIVPETASLAGQPYGDVTVLNTERTILDAVGKDLLHDIVSDYMNLLETSSAVYEKNGDYAYGIFSSGWCQAMDMASFRACGTADNRLALSCGKWHCHESCWNEASRKSIESNQPTDIECQGGIRLHAVPIRAGEEIIGSINFGYGNPPHEPSKLRQLAAKYGLSVEELERNGAAYQQRPPFIIELAKERLLASARLIGEIVQRKRAERQLRQLNASLENRVAERTAALEHSNKELEAFSYSVSHDLRAPLRALDAYSRILVEDYGARLDHEGLRVLGVLRGESKRMGILIDDLLSFSRISRQLLRSFPVDLEALVRSVFDDLKTQAPHRSIHLKLGPLPKAMGDQAVLRQAFVNLLSNAIKFTGPRAEAVIQVGEVDPKSETFPSTSPTSLPSITTPGKATFFVRDNGVGFDMRHAGKLFRVFQRLHSEEEFEGTGVGLALVQRIINRHGGQVWAEAKPDQGATFYFTLPTPTTL